jgi:hypothetical protein
LVLTQVLGASCSAHTRICPPAASFLAVAHLLSCLGEELICLSLVLVPDTRRSLVRLALICPPARAHSSGADLSFAEQGACPVFLFSVVQRYFLARFFGCGCWFIKSSLSSPQVLTGLWTPFAFLPSPTGLVHSLLGSLSSDSQESATTCLADFICSIPCRFSFVL